MPEKIFVSYTSSDREWAHWIGVTLRDHGYVPLVHEWEVGAGQNIARWMDEALGASDRLLGVFTDAYAKALYSSSERWSAYWDDPAGRRGFLVPIEVEHVTNWPPLTRALKRLSLVGLSETEAENALLAFLQPPKPPNPADPRPPYPGGVAPKVKDSVVTHAPTVPDGLGERLPTKRPAWPTALDLERPHVSIKIKEPGLRWTINGKPVALGLKQLEYSVVNYGKTPAFLLVLFAKLEVGKDLPPCIDLSKQPGLKLPYGVIAGSDKPYDFRADWPSEPDMKEVGPNGKDIFLISYLSYSDISDNHYMIGFCQMLDCAGRRFVPVGDERYNYVRQVQQRQLEYLTYRDSDLSSAIIGMARCSAWGRWYAAQHLVKSGVVIIQRHLLHMAAGKVMDKMLDGDLDVRGRRPGKMAYESISRTDWRSSAFCVVDGPLTLWKIIICPRGGVRIEPDGTVHASDAVAAHRTAYLDYDSLIVEAYQFEKLWPKTDAIADKERHNFLAEARQRGLDKDEILRLSSPESPQQTAPPTISVASIHAVEENKPAIGSQLTGKQAATEQKRKAARALADEQHRGTLLSELVGWIVNKWGAS